ncbi:MAG: NUDIX domain-containing protein [Litorivicinaceae bacterium]|jgi:8-oxo-dGTP diphosphatase|nr:NUDIX domain-containing protein [Litorivicinaceae bacterium]MDP5328569.1 NUDIX domain-containing protein [Litorivicinaceae bacterium]MDP5343163.1 NUDIX domain-containing protein [Litorivicinaceae bacterium]
MPNIEPELHVACAVIRQGNQVLLSQRLASAHQGGLWEFPGGKVAAQESPEDALARELDEELGIQVRASRFRFQIPWDYGDRRVRLWVFDVDAFAGLPTGREGQVVRWVSLDDVSGYHFPSANNAIVQTLALPRIVRFYDPALGPPNVWLDAWHAPVLLYFRGVQELDELSQLIDRALSIGHRVILPITQHALWREGVGLHRQKGDGRALAEVALERCPGAWPLTAGCRSLDDWRAQVDWPAHAWFVSPVLPTDSHPDLEPLGWAGFRDLAQHLARPCYALGGVTPGDLDHAIAAGGFGVAGIRGFQ